MSAAEGRETVAEIATERESRLFRECLYCGQPSLGLACRGHRDLLAVDPNTYDLRLQGRNRESNEAAAVQTDNAAASSTEGDPTCIV